MIYEFPDTSMRIRQGDIFIGISMAWIFIKTPSSWEWGPVWGGEEMKLFHVQFRGKDFYANEHATGLIITLYDLWSGGYSTEGIQYDGITPVVDGLRDKRDKHEFKECDDLSETVRGASGFGSTGV